MFARLKRILPQAAIVALATGAGAGRRAGVHQRADRRHLGGLLPARRRAFGDLRRGHRRARAPRCRRPRRRWRTSTCCEQGKGEIAFSLGDSVKAAVEGNTEAGFPGPLDKLRGIAAIYPNYIQIVASKDSGIETLDDLKGKSLSVGAPASGTELNARAIFAAAGMSYDDLGRVEYLPFAESVELIKNRQLDATLQSAGLGVASIRDLATSVPINVVAVPPEIVAAIGAPFLGGDHPGRHLRRPGRRTCRRRRSATSSITQRRRARTTPSTR